MCGRPSTTIGFERLFNTLARMDRLEFTTALTSGVPARPLNMTAIEATNRGAADMPWAMLTSALPAAEIDIEALEARTAAAVRLDVREPAEYALGHVPGAINLPQADLAMRLEELPRDRPIDVICQGGFRSLRAAQFLKQMGFEQVTSVKGGTVARSTLGRPLVREEARVEVPRIAESEWAHAFTAPGD